MTNIELFALFDMIERGWKTLLVSLGSREWEDVR